MIGNEYKILELLQGIRSELLNTVFEYITMLGEETIMILILAILYFAYNKKIAQKLFYVVVTSMSINGIIKSLAKIPRPFVTHNITCVRESTATGYSFPSGHTQTFSTAISGIAYLVKKTWLWIIAMILIVLVGFSRMYLGAHYLSDVLAGGILGITIAISASIIFDKIKDYKKLYFFTILLLTPFIIYFTIEADTMSKGLFKQYGMLIGLLLAVIVEERYAPLTYDVSLIKKVIRVILALVLAFTVKEGIKLIVSFESVSLILLWNAFRYIMVVFVPFGIFPILIKKLKL